MREGNEHGVRNCRDEHTDDFIQDNSRRVWIIHLTRGVATNRDGEGKEKYNHRQVHIEIRAICMRYQPNKRQGGERRGGALRFGQAADATAGGEGDNDF